MSFDYNGYLTLSNAISGSGSLAQVGPGTTTLAAVNTYTGGTTVSAGGLNDEIANAISTTGTLTVEGTGTVNLANYAQKVGGLADGGVTTGTITDSGGAATLTVNDASASSFSGTISGAIALTDAGSGTLTLAGNNTYSGLTTISAGMLQIGNGGATGSLGTGSVTNNAELSFDLSSNITVANNIDGSGNLIQAGSGTTTLTATNYYGGMTTINNGTLGVGVANAIPSTSDVTDNAALDLDGHSDTIGALGGNGGSEVTNSVAGAVTLTVGATGDSANFHGLILNESGTVALTKLGAGTETLSAANEYSGATTISAGTLKLGAANAIPTPSDVTDNATLDLGSASDTIGALSGSSSGLVTTTSLAVNVTLTVGTTNDSGIFSGVIQSGSGTVSLTKIGTGIETLSGANTYTGATIISDGTLQAGVANAVPSTSDVIDSATLDLDGHSDTIGGLSGSGIITSSVAGAVTLTIDATNHGGLFSGVIQNGSGTLTLVMIGTGTEGLLNNNTYSGTTTISSGTLQISNGGTSGSVGTGSVIDNATLDFVLASNVTVANVISGSGNLIQEFTGTTTLTGANTYTGTTTITKGTLQVNGSLASGSAVTIASAGTLGGSGTVGGTVAANSGGTLSPGDDPGILGTGSLTLSSGSSFNAEIGGNTAGDGSSYYSQDDVTGTVSLGGATLNLSSFDSYVPQSGDDYVLISNDGSDAVSGTFVAGTGIDAVSSGTALPEGLVLSSNFLGSGLTATITYKGGDGNDVAIIVSTPTASLSVSTHSLNLGTTTAGTASSSQSYTVSGSNLTASVVVAAPSGVELSSDNGSTWHSSLTLTETGGVLGSTTIDARISASATAGSISGNISNTSTGATEQDVAVSGTVTPVVTSSSASLAVTATSLTITGVGFSTTAGNDSVSFSGGVTGTVTAATSTQLTVTSLSGLVLGNLNASVTVDSISSGTAVEVAKVVPVVTSSSVNLAVNATSLTINGFGFSTTASNNTVSFSGGTTGTVTTATATQLTVTSLSGLVLGNLTASVTVSGVSSGNAVQVATVIPVVTSSTANLAVNATSLTINGFGFSTTAGNNTVTFGGGVTGTVTTATATQLTVTSLSGLALGSLTASVTVSGVSSGTAVQVATVVPVVTSSSASLPVTATSVTINGFGFSTTAGNDSVSFSGGVTGTVTTATATQLTVTSLSGLVVGNLNASVSVSGVSSGTAVQVATVVPVVSSSTANLAVNATSLTINGFGFSTTAGNDSVTFSGGVTGTVTSASSTQLTVTSLSGLVLGNLTASVTVSGVSSGTAVQVATVVPVVTSSSASLSVTATSMTINGFGFSTTAGNNTVSFSGGVTGTVTSATGTQLTVTSLNGLTVGNLNASVSVSGISSGTAVQVATVVAAGPVVTPSSANLPVTATSLTINGSGFSTTASNNTVSFSGGVSGTVTSASSTQLTVTSLSGLVLGDLNASVSVSGVSSGTAVQVATVVPVVTSSSTSLAVNATSLIINGFGFSTTAGSNTVSFSGGVTGTVTSATSTQLTVTSLSGLVLGSLTTSVSVNSVSSGSAVQVATVIPVVTSSSANLAANATSLTINGFGFDSTAGDNTVSFSGGVAGTVTSASSTQLTVTSLSGLAVGNLTASVTVDGVSSGTAVEVAAVIPVVTSSTGNLAANATSLTINGFGFSTTASNNTVSFSGGVTGTVTSASSTQLTVTSLSGLVVGNLTASVSVNGVSSGTAVQVATVIPVVTASAADVSVTATSLTINGFGFDSTAGNDTVSFSGGVTGTVTSASSTQLTVTSLTGLVVGNLNASVTVDGVSSGTAVQVATVVSSANSVTNVQVDDGTSQRSMVRSITLTFQNAISAANLSSVLASLSLTRASDGLSVGLKGTLDSSGTVLTLTFTGSSIIGGSLADGRYNLLYGSTSLLAAGTSGQTDETKYLWRLFGDLSGTACVNAADLTAFNKAMNSRKGMSNYTVYFDYNEDGIIVNSDQTAFNQRYGTSI